MNPVSEQMFDWIFFAIVLLPAAFIAWDWMKERGHNTPSASARREMGS